MEYIELIEDIDADNNMAFSELDLLALEMREAILCEFDDGLILL